MPATLTGGVREKSTAAVGRGGFAEAFLGGAKGRVLALLLVRSAGPMHLREVAREADVALGQLQREMRVLVDEGLLTRRREAGGPGRVLYEPDRDHPLHGPLVALLLADQGGVAGLLRARLAPLVALGPDVGIAAALLTAGGELVVVGAVSAGQVVAAVAHAEVVTDRPLPVTVLRRPDLAAADARAWLDRRLLAGVTWLYGDAALLENQRDQQ